MDIKLTKVNTIVFDSVINYHLQMTAFGVFLHLQSKLTSPTSQLTNCKTYLILLKNKIKTFK